jgi:hypothetical protein
LKILFSVIFSTVMGTMSWQAAAPPKLVPWVLRVSEVRQDLSANQRCKSARVLRPRNPDTPEFPVTVYSQLTVGEDGSVIYREALACQGPIEDTPLGKWPSEGNPNQVFPAQLSASELADLTTLLNRQDVKEIRDFLNQAPIFDNYEIHVKHGKDEQHILVTAFMPDHFELKQKPALTQLICRAKGIAARASSTTEIPNYCQGTSAR